MRVFALHLLAAGLFVGLANAQPGQDEAHAILEKAIKAQGGAELINKHQAATIRSKGTLEILGSVPIEQEISFQLPSKFRDESTLNINGMEIKTLTVFDGKKGALTVNGKKIDLGEKLQESLREAAQMLPISKLVPLRDKAYELSPAGEVQVNGKPAVGIRAVKKGQSDVTLYFDKGTYLLAKLDHRTLDPMSGQEVTQERIITEYKKMDGVPVPAKILINRDGKKFMEAEILELKNVEKFDDSQFAVP